MSRVAVLFIAIIAICLSCTREPMDIAHVNSQALTGVWEIRFSSGGEPAHIETHYAPGNGHLYIVTHDSGYITVDSVLYNLGAYHIDDRGVNPFTQQTINRLVYKNSQPVSYEIKNDTLTFYPDENMVAWGYTSQYVKIADDTILPVHY